MRKVLVAAVSAVLSLTTIGCGGGGDAPFAEAAPADLSALSLEISGAVDEGAALTAVEGVQRQGLDTPANQLAIARDRVKALNGAVRQLITGIAELTVQSGKLLPGDVRVFGPKVKNGVAYKLTVKRFGADRFGWKLEAKAEAAPEADYAIVAAGGLTKGALPHRGRGTVGMDLDKLRALDTSIKPAGKIFCAFAHVGDTKTLVYGLKGFTADPAVEQPMSAHFVGHRLMPSKATAVRVAGRFNLADTATPAQELVRTRIRWLPGVGGVAKALATEGDVPAGKVYIGHACWDAQEQEGFAIVRSCDRGVAPSPATCAVIVTRGQLSNCKLTEPADLSEDVDDAAPETEAPAGDLVAPTDMPSIDG